MSQDPVPSPCVDICALNVDDICVGCYRSGDEISQWWAMSDAEKRAVHERIDLRARQAAAGPNSTK